MIFILFKLISKMLGNILQESKFQFNPPAAALGPIDPDLQV